MSDSDWTLSVADEDSEMEGEEEDAAQPAGSEDVEEEEEDAAQQVDSGDEEEVEESGQEEVGPLISLVDLSQTDHPCLARGNFCVFHSKDVRPVTELHQVQYMLELDRLVVLSK